MANWEKLKEKGNELFRNKDYSSAINCYNQALKLNPKESTLYGNRATCLKLLGKYKQAIKDYQLSLELNPKNTKNIKKLASVHVILGNFGEADMLYQKCINLEPRDSAHKTDLNSIKEKTGLLERIDEKKKVNEWATVEEIAEKMLVESPEFTHLKEIYIEALIENVKLPKVINYLLNKVTADEKEINGDFNFNLARCYYYNTDYAKAKSLLENIMKTKMEEDKYNKLMNYINNIEQEKTKANEYFKAGNFDKAIEEYNKLIEYDPSNKAFISVIYANRSLCHKKQKKLTDALKDAELSIKTNPSYVKGYLRRGNVYMDLKMFDEAKTDFEKVKEFEPNNKEAENSILQARQEADKARTRDYYEILGISKNASQDEIKKAYRKMALKWHPDRNAESEETKKIAQKKFIDIGDAYNVLSDPKKKQMYDSGMDPLNPEHASSGGMNFQSVDPNQIFKMFFGGGGGDSFFSSGGMNDDFGGFSGFPNMGGQNRGGHTIFTHGGNGGSFGSFFPQGGPGGSGGGFPFDILFQSGNPGKKK